MTKAFKGEVVFTSPINMENSFGAWNISDESESTIEVQIRENGSGWFEWDVPELDEVYSGSLTFEGNTLTEYDGLFELPMQLLDFLEKQGYNVDEMKFL